MPRCHTSASSPSAFASKPTFMLGYYVSKLFPVWELFLSIAKRYWRCPLLPHSTLNLPLQLLYLSHPSQKPKTSQFSSFITSCCLVHFPVQERPTIFLDIWSEMHKILELFKKLVFSLEDLLRWTIQHSETIHQFILLHSDIQPTTSWEDGFHYCIKQLSKLNQIPSR